MIEKEEKNRDGNNFVGWRFEKWNLNFIYKME
jgi:hypothetical protein